MLLNITHITNTNNDVNKKNLIEINKNKWII